MRLSTKAPFSTLKRPGAHATQSSPIRLPKAEPAQTPVQTQAPAGQTAAFEPEAQAVPEPVQQPESRERGWLRVTRWSETEWLAADEGERRFRLQAASRLAGTDLTTPQREQLLQRIDAHCAAETGQPTPVYRGIPVRDDMTSAPNTSSVHAQPEAPAPRSEAAIEAAPQAGAAAPPAPSAPTVPSTGKMLLVAGVGLAAVALLSSMTAPARANPSGKRRKKTWWQRMWGSSEKPAKKRRTKAK